MTHQWSTPSVADVTGGRKSRSGDRSGELLNNSLAPYLTNNVYPTPTALSRPRNDDTLAKCAAYRKAKAGQNMVPLYLEEVVTWATPRASDGEKGGPNQAFGAGGVPLAAMSAHFSALQAQPTSTPGEWSPNTLLASYLRYRATTCSALRRERRALLLMAIRRRDAKAARKPARHGGAQVRAHRVGWTRERATLWTRPAFRRQLNPRFVEWLMAWPPGSTNFACSETAWSIHAAHWRSVISQLSSPPAPAAQLSLFA